MIVWSNDRWILFAAPNSDRRSIIQHVLAWLGFSIRQYLTMEEEKPGVFRLNDAIGIGHNTNIGMYLCLFARKVTVIFVHCRACNLIAMICLNLFICTRSLKLKLCFFIEQYKYFYSHNICFLPVTILICDNKNSIYLLQNACTDNCY